MRRLCGTFVAAVALALAGGALAVTGGTPDATHTYVGAILQQQTQNGAAGTELCSGFLVSATELVSAAHCFQGTEPIRVTFDETVTAQSTFVTATLVGTRDDVAVLSVPAQPGPYATLPAAGQSATASAVDVVGYGLQGLTPEKLPTAFGTRELATTPVKSAGNVSGTFLKLLANPGACFGDSGGPNLLPGTDTVVAITSSGLKNCNGVSYAERLDTPEMLAFLANP